MVLAEPALPLPETFTIGAIAFLLLLVVYTLGRIGLSIFSENLQHAREDAREERDRMFSFLEQRDAARQAEHKMLIEQQKVQIEALRAIELRLAGMNGQSRRERAL